MRESEPTLFRVTASRILGGTLFASAAGTLIAAAACWLGVVGLSAWTGLCFAAVGGTGHSGANYGGALAVMFGLWGGVFALGFAAVAVALQAGGLFAALGAGVTKEKLRGVSALTAVLHVVLGLGGLAGSIVAYLITQV